MKRKIFLSLAHILLLSMLIAFPLAGCKPHETDLNFETIEQKDEPYTGKRYESGDPGIMVITKVEEISNVDSWVSDAAISTLNTLDYQSNFAIVVFQGRKPTDRYSVQIERITRSEDKVFFYIKIM